MKKVTQYLYVFGIMLCGILSVQNIQAAGFEKAVF